MRRSFTARRFLVWRFREVGTRQRCELKRRYDTSIKLNSLKCRPDVLLTYIHIGGVYWNTLINDVCFFCFVGLAGYHWNHGRFMLCFIPTKPPSQQLRLASRPLLYLVFWVLPGGWGVRLRQDGDEDFPEKMCLDPKKYTPWMIVPKWCLVSRIFFVAFFFFLPHFFLCRHFILMKQHLWMLEHIFWKLP